jgi:hypothetical protein
MLPLILAIEPDRRQASQLKKLVKSVGAELVLADTTEGALDAIGNRIPDLVLVPALLSPQDDAALATALRVIATAAHVQTLTIPVFAGPTARTGGGSSSGVLGKWRRERTHSAAPEGCNPGVFAEQIAAYLAEAAAERKARMADAEYYAPPASKPIVQPRAAAAPFELDAWLDPSADQDADAPPMNEPVAAENEPSRRWFENDRQPMAQSFDDDRPPTVRSFEDDQEPTAPSFTDESEPAVLSFEPDLARPVSIAPESFSRSAFEWPVITPEQEPLAVAEPEPFHARADAPADAYAASDFDPGEIDISDFLAGLAEPHPAPIADDPVLAAAEIAAPIDDLVMAAEQPDPVDELSTAAARWLEREPDAIADFETWMTRPVPPQRRQSKLEPANTESRTLEQRATPVVEPEAVVVARPEAPQADVEARPEPAASEWVDMLEALRRDIDRLRIEAAEVPVPAAARSTPRTAPQAVQSAPSKPVQPVAAVAAAASVDPEQAPPRKKRRKKEQRPVQDEWGFFDPAQCGFTALLAKLDEINKANDESF